MRKWISISLDAPEYEGMWAKLEELGMPVVLHNAAPEGFWDETLIPEWAREHGCFYGDGTFPLKEELYAEMDRVLERHPGLKLILAHFYFLSADLARAGDFFDAHPNVCFDLTPGLEMCNNFAQNRDAAREFLIQYQDRLIYGTDITSEDLERGNQFGMTTSLGKAWVVRSLLEMDDVFTPLNFERMYGIAPAPLDRERAIVELERLAAVLDAQAGGKAAENQARQVSRELKLDRQRN